MVARMINHPVGWRHPAKNGRPSGWKLARPVLVRHKRALARLAAWSVLGVTPVMVSGQLVAAALDRGFLAGDGGFGLAMLGCYGATLLAGAFANRQAVLPMAEIVEALRNHIVRATVRGSLLGAVVKDQPPETSAVSRITSQTEKVRQILSGLLLSVSSIGFTLVAAIVGLFSLVPLVGLIMLPIAVVAGFTIVRISRVWKRRYEESLAAEEALADNAGRTLNGLRDVMACAATNRAATDLDRSLRANAQALTAVANIGGLRVGVIGLSARIPLITLLLLAPWLVSSGALSVGALLGSATYLISGLEPALRTLVQSIGNMGLELVTLLNRLARYSEAPELPSGGSLALDRYDLSLSGVTFRYGPHSQPVLDRANVEIPYGEHVVVVGPSGIGKSTLVGVLAGLETPETGVVRLGGMELERLRAEWLRETIALVPQQAYVFAGTVRENLTYLAPWAREPALDRAVTAMGLEDVVRAHGGYDGKFEQPDTLSEGEQQLITLARVYLSPARVVILDEATCHLDPGAEERVERAFARRSGTLIVIAHRISSALRAQRVLVLDGDGIHSGTHGTLLRASPTYANLVGYWHSSTG
jgi:ABC-type multidrug transport system fused ATPase/permease subunit